MYIIKVEDISGKKATTTWVSYDIESFYKWLKWYNEKYPNNSDRFSVMGKVE